MNDFASTSPREDLILGAIYDFFATNPRATAISREQLIASLDGQVAAGLLVPTIYDLMRRKLMRRKLLTTGAMSPLDRDPRYELTPTGILAVEQSRASLGSEGDTTDDAEIPASDRVVRLDDNSSEREEAVTALTKIEEVLGSASNSLPLEAQEREVIESELRGLRQRLQAGWIRLGDLWQAVTKGSPLVWLADKVAGLTLGAVVTGAITAIGLLLAGLVG
jgi:hypothetical protein